MSKPPLSKVPLLMPAVALSTGIALGVLGGFVYIFATALVGAAVALLTRRTMILALTVIFTVGLVESHATLSADHALPTARSELFYRGEIKAARITDRGQTLRMILDRWGTDSTAMQRMSPVRLQLAVPDFSPEYSQGQTILVKIMPERIGQHAVLPDEITPESYLLRQHIYYHAITPSENIRIVSNAHGLQAQIRSLGREAEHKLFMSRLEPDTKLFLDAALLGNSELLDADTRDTFARAGLAHVLALSGLHVGLIAFIISLLLYPLEYMRHRRAALALMLVAVWFYAFMTGLSPSVVRAVTMASVYTLARIFQRRHSPLNSLCFAAIVILVEAPESLFNIGFQLSFAAVLSIILFAEKLTPVSRRRRVLYTVVSYIAVSISAMAGTSLLSMIYFHSFPVYFLIANIVTALLLPPLIAGGLLVTALQWAGLSFMPLDSLVDFLYSIIECVSRFVTGLSGSSAGDIFLPGWTVVPFALVAALLCASLHYRRRRLVYATVAAAVIVIAGALTLLRPTSDIDRSIYVPDRTQRTDIIIPSPTSLDIYTTAKAVELAEVRSESDRRFRRYMAVRGIDSLRVLRISGGAMRFDSLYLLHADSLLNALPRSMKYLLVCRGVRSTVTQLTARHCIDTLVFSADMNLLTVRRRIEECRLNQQPFISLRDHTLRLSHPSRETIEKLSCPEKS